MAAAAPAPAAPADGGLTAAAARSFFFFFTLNGLGPPARFLRNAGPARRGRPSSPPPAAIAGL